MATRELVIDILHDALLLAYVGVVHPRAGGLSVSVLPIGTIGGRRGMCPRTGASLLPIRVVGATSLLVVPMATRELVIDVLHDALLLAYVGAIHPRAGGPGVSMLPIGTIGGRRGMCPRAGVSLLPIRATSLLMVLMVTRELVIDVLHDALLLAGVGAVHPRAGGSGVSVLPVGTIGDRGAMRPCSGVSLLPVGGSGRLVITVAAGELLLDLAHDALLLAGAVSLVLHPAPNLSLGKSTSGVV
uniref:Uncharacterized protein n=1 Tax=Triticum urartu TaxID=4572 RepID=A0A8R7UUS7_TRIUA